MRRSWLTAMAVLGITSAVPAASEDVSLRGVWVHGQETELYLVKGDSARWLKVGDCWGDVVIESFDRSSVVARVRDRHDERQLVLIHGHIASSREAFEILGRKIIADNLSMLAACACQFLLEQQQGSVRAADLVGRDRAVYCVEPAADETYDDGSFRVGANGIELRIAGTEMPVTALPQPLVIQVQPTQSLAAISEHLKIPLAELRNLNPRLAAVGRFTAVEAVRLH